MVMANKSIMASLFAIAISLPVFLSLLLLLFLRGSFSKKRNLSKSSKLPLVPRVPGLPILGNLLQLRDMKPHKTCLKLADIYGPIYMLQFGSSPVIVINNPNIAKEAMVLRFSSITTRTLTSALTILTYDKCMVATSDYDDFHKATKKIILNCLLGPNAQKRKRFIRETMMENIVDRFNTHVKSRSLQTVNFREIFESELFRLALKQEVGQDIESVYVEELGTTVSREEMYRIFIVDMVEGSLNMDWRDFFPSLKWIPNKKFETKLKNIDFRRQVVMKAMIKEHKKRSGTKKETNCYLDCLLSEANTMTESQLAVLLWEPIIESTSTTLMTTEWAIFELSKHPERQDRLYREIQIVCGNHMVNEDHLPKMPYLSAIFHETIRMYSPLPMIPMRYVHEDTEIAGYHIPAGSKILINLYGCNRDKVHWKNAQEWNPERFLDERYDPHDLYKTMSFGGGKRVCSGSLQAMLIACTSIGRLVQQFKWSLQPGEEDDFDTIPLTTQKLHSLHAIIKARGHFG